MIHLAQLGPAVIPLSGSRWTRLGAAGRCSGLSLEASDKNHRDRDPRVPRGRVEALAGHIVGATLRRCGTTWAPPDACSCMTYSCGGSTPGPTAQALTHRARVPLRPTSWPKLARPVISPRTAWTRSSARRSPQPDPPTNPATKRERNDPTARAARNDRHSPAPLEGLGACV
jgi:hypothetical protein